MGIRRAVQRVVNSMLQPAGLYIMRDRCAPHGFADALLRARKAGIAITEVVDIGAARGEWTMECLRVYPEAAYFLVDPLEENVASLKRLASRHKNVHFWQGGIGSQAQKQVLFASGDQSSLYASEYPPDSTNPRREIEVRTLDSFLGPGGLRAPGLLKADVQGYELEVLKGGIQVLRLAEMVLLELHFRRNYDGAPLAHEVIAFMAQRGYRIYDICSHNNRPGDSELLEGDVMFAKEGSALFSRESEG